MTEINHLGTGATFPSGASVGPLNVLQKKMEGQDLRLGIPATFQGLIRLRFDPFPYFEPGCAASSIQTYSTHPVPYPLSLAWVIQPPSYWQELPASISFHGTPLLVQTGCHGQRLP